MKILIWSLFGVLMLVWIGVAWVSAELAGWLVQAAGSAPAGQVAQDVGQWPVPEWVAFWVSPELIQALQATWIGAVEWIIPWLPSADSLTSVINVLVWGVWALGALVLLVLAGLAHWLVSQGSRRFKSTRP
jgi:hypothetical protein